MIRLAADLHIHSCLSPCANADMTPNNLVNMAYLKGLDAIAVCDHNTTRNLPACKAVADERGMVFICGMEVETKEEVHILTLFEQLEDAMRFGEWVYEHLPDMPNMPDFFGEQQAMNEDDQVIYVEPRMLLQSTTLSISEVVNECRTLGGVAIPAHINRTSNSLLNNLGFIPADIELPSLEVYKGIPVNGVELSKYHILHNSDSHSLENILEREQFVGAYERSAGGLLRYLNEKK